MSIFQIPVLNFTAFKALVRQEEVPLGRYEEAEEPIMSVPEVILGTEKKLMEAKTVLAEALEKSGFHQNDLNIIAACEDFFDSTSIARNACMDVGTAYRFIAKDLVELSKAHPNVIIAPGSMYISTPIPETHPNLKFIQDGCRQLLGDTTCYTANVMPILFNGELLGMVRKGEKTKAGTVKTGTPIDDIDRLTAEGSDHLETGSLAVPSYHEDTLTDMEDETRKSTCYLGKTMLPGEKKLIEEIFQKPAEAFFKHDFEIGGNRFLFALCGEFRSEDGKSTVARLLEENNYDVIVHSTLGGAMPSEMVRKGKIYVHVDGGNDNEFLSRRLGKIDGEINVSTTSNTSTIDYFRARGWLEDEDQP